MQVWKFPLPEVADRIMVQMPLGCRILCLQKQLDRETEQEIPTLWAAVDDVDARTVPVEIMVVGTGWEFEEGFPGLDSRLQWMARYIGTVQVGPLVWHYWLNTRCGVRMYE